MPPIDEPPVAEPSSDYTGWTAQDHLNAMNRTIFNAGGFSNVQLTDDYWKHYIEYIKMTQPK